MNRVINVVVFLLFLCVHSLAQATDLNRVPNPGFEGSDGSRLGNVSGTIPDYWRAFGLDGGDVSIAIVPLAANALYTGSPATNAVQLTINSYGAAQAFDHETTPFSFSPGHNYSAQVYLRSANSGGESQQVTVSFPVFNESGFTGREAGSFAATVTGDWQKYSGPEFMEAAGTAGDIAFRLTDDGGENSILIAMPTVLGPAPETPAVNYPPIYTPGRDFSDTDRFVSTIVFHWYNTFSGQLTGPWRPLEGRGNWTGEVPWWREQIKDIMDANIEVVYVHLFNGFGFQREQFFSALHQLRSEGYDTPYVLPFLDPLIIWDGNPIDMRMESAKDEYVDSYRLWFDQYFRNEIGALAESRILHINGRVALNTWHGNPGYTDNLSALTRNDLESRLEAAFGEQYPSFKNGVYQMATANGVAPGFSDEIAYQFSNTEYYSTYEFNNKKVATVKGGYWDQNVRNPGSFLARDGGSPYRTAWEDLNAARDGSSGNLPIYHAYIESWNEYDEASGIYSGNTDAPYIAPANTSGNDDVWSNTNNPREYIDTTYEGASEFNDHPDLGSQFLWHDFPASLAPGESTEVQILVRNAGDIKWSDATGIKLAQAGSDSHVWGPSRQTIAPGPNEVEKYGGVFRGRPVLFRFTITAPATPGVYQAHYQMVRDDGGEAPFGDQLTVQVAVGATAVEAGHSGAFFNANRNGEGSYVEILKNGRAVVYTFSYRPDGSGPAWFIGVGTTENNAIVIDELFRPAGTVFGADFKAGDIVFSNAGTMSMSFMDCDSIVNPGSTVFSGDAGLGLEGLLTRADRLSQITGCSVTPTAKAGLSGSFYDPGRNGEGLVVEWLHNGLVLVIMFTYDLDGNQMWMFGIGEPDGNSVTLEALYPSGTTKWGSDFNPDDVVLSTWGTFTITWSDCDTVIFEYDSSLPGYGAATRNYTRLTYLAGTDCPAFP